MTRLVASVQVDTIESVSRIESIARNKGADAVELRLDRYEDNLQQLVNYASQRTDLLWILTRKQETNDPSSSDDNTVRLVQLVSEIGEDHIFVDVDLSLLAEKGQAQTSEKLTKLLTKCNPNRTILSFHDYDRLPPDLETRIAEMRSACPEATTKIAYQPTDIRDTFTALDIMHENGPNSIAIAMGGSGLMSRVLAGKLGAHATFASLDETACTAPGQVSVKKMKELFGWDRISPNTRVFGVIGKPVSQSLSPMLMNALFHQDNIDAVFLPLEVDADQEVLKGFLRECKKRPWLDIGGFSVTMPHKVKALTLIGDRADALSRSIGAINTIRFRDGEYEGCNTDSPAAIESILYAIGANKPEMQGVTVDLLGVGGAARAVAAGLQELGCRVSVYGRNPRATEKFASDFQATPKKWADRGRRSGEIVINATCLGMAPAVNESPLLLEALDGCSLVFDMVYNPAETMLIKLAKQNGTNALGGLEMFVRQAAMQFEWWTQCKADLDLARRIISSATSPGI